ncbi:MAG: hypothetical protein NVSMB12_13740 [Acidimicrobiales bacterium]
MDGSETLAGLVVADRYRLAERIGVGGMAEVRRADDLRLGRPVAVKFLDPHLAAQPDLRRRFEDEARAAARLNHPSVVQVFDSGEWEGRPFLVMELLSGRTLADEMAGGPLPVDRVRGAAADVLSALGAAHAAGVLHRDVKPANLLIGADGAVKIADFGIAKADPIQGERSASETEAAPVTMTGQMLGTPSYLAPERIAGKPATPATDVWALGVVCWEALAGRRAFPGAGIQTAIAVASTDLPPIRDVRPDTDPQFAHAIDVAVRRDPATRWASAADMQAAMGERPAGLGAAGLGAAGLGAAGLGAAGLGAAGLGAAGLGAAGLGAAGLGAGGLGVAATDATVASASGGGAAPAATEVSPAFAPGASAAAADATVVGAAPLPPAAGGPIPLPEAWGLDTSESRAAAFGLIAIAVVAGIIALVALAGGGHPKTVSSKGVTATTALRPVTTTSTSTSTSTTTTLAPDKKKGPGASDQGGGGD